MVPHNYTYQSDFAKRFYGQGREHGLEEGFDKGLAKGLAKGLEKGLEKGREMGLQRGLEQGREQGRRDTLCEQLELRFGELPADVTSKLEQASSELLSRWTRRVLTAATLAEVFATDEP